MSAAKRMRRHRELQKEFTFLLTTRHHVPNAATHADCVLNSAFCTTSALLPSHFVSSTTPLAETDHFDCQTTSSSPSLFTTTLTTSGNSVVKHTSSLLQGILLLTWPFFRTLLSNGTTSPFIKHSIDCCVLCVVRC